MMNPDTGKPWKYADACAAVDTRDRDRSAISNVPKRSGMNGFFSHHHRQFSSRGGHDSPANLMLVLGSGTLGEHEWIQRNAGAATVLGYAVPSWADPAEVPIYRLDAFGNEWGWFLQGHDGQLTATDPPAAHEPHVIEAAMRLLVDLKAASVLTANEPFRRTR